MIYIILKQYLEVSLQGERGGWGGLEKEDTFRINKMKDKKIIIQQMKP